MTRPRVLVWLTDRCSVTTGTAARATEGQGGTPPPKGPTVPGVDRGADAQQLREGMEKIREHLRRFGAALGAVGTAVLAGVGYSTIHNIFPVPAGSEWVYWVAPLLLLAGAGGALWLISRFFAAQRRIVFVPSLISPEPLATTDEPSGRDMRKKERRLVRQVLTEHAHEEGAVNARALEMRMMRLQRLARQRKAEDADSPSTKAIQEEADRLDDVLTLAGLRAATSVLEERSRRVFVGFPSFLALVLAAGGIFGVVLVADYSKGQRDLIQLREACVKAVDAGASNACDPVDVTSPPEPTGADVAVIQRLQDCVREAQALPTAIAVPTDSLEVAINDCAHVGD